MCVWEISGVCTVWGRGEGNFRCVHCIHVREFQVCSLCVWGFQVYMCACVNFMCVCVCVCKNIYVSWEWLHANFICVCMHEVTSFYTWPLFLVLAKWLEPKLTVLFTSRPWDEMVCSSFCCSDYGCELWYLLMAPRTFYPSMFISSLSDFFWSVMGVSVFCWSVIGVSIFCWSVVSVFCWTVMGVSNFCWPVIGVCIFFWSLSVFVFCWSVVIVFCWSVMGVSDFCWSVTSVFFSVGHWVCLIFVGQ